MENEIRTRLSTNSYCQWIRSFLSGGTQYTTFRAILLCLFILFVIINFASQDRNATPAQPVEDNHSSTSSTASADSTDPSTRLPSVVWDAPDEVKGILFAFHGCGHEAKDWFRLPEDVKIKNTALRHGLAFVALTSISSCWTESDISPTFDTIDNYQKKWKGVPSYAVGASSGGTFVSLLAQEPDILLSGITIIISPGLPTDYFPRHPPTVFIYMPRDTDWASQTNIEVYANLLEAAKVPCKIFVCLPRPLNASTFTEHMDGISPELSQELYKQLQVALDDQGYLLRNPRWTPSLTESLLQTISTKGDPLHRSTEDLYESFDQILNKLFAAHEMTSEYWEEGLNWMLQNSMEVANATQSS